MSQHRASLRLGRVNKIAAWPGHSSEQTEPNCLIKEKKIGGSGQAKIELSQFWPDFFKLIN